MQQDVQRHQQRTEHIEALLQEVAEFPDARMRTTTEELIQALLDMYGEGLARILELTMQAGATGITLSKTFAHDELLEALFLLHDLHPLSLETRIEQALVEVRPYLKSHGGNVEFVKVENGVAHLRLEGSCQGCGASTITLKTTIEEAVYKAAPDLEGLQVEGVTPAPQAAKASIPVTFVAARKRKESTQPVELR